jgi:hypothetical protein
MFQGFHNPAVTSQILVVDSSMFGVVRGGVFPEISARTARGRDLLLLNRPLV